MNFHSSTPKTDCRNETNQIQIVGNSLLTYMMSSMLQEIIHKMLFSVWKNKETQWKTLFILFWWTFTQAHLKQIAEMKTPDLNCRKTVFWTVIISSMLSEIIHIILYNHWKSMETPWKIHYSIILMNFHSSTPKKDCRNEKHQIGFIGKQSFWLI